MRACCSGSHDTNGQVDREFLQEEVSQLLQEIDRVATQTKYNGQTVLDGSLQNKSIQVGTEAGQTVSFSVAGINAVSLMLDGTHTTLRSTGKTVDWHGGDYVGSHDGFFDGQIQAGDIVAFESDLEQQFTVQRLSDGGGTVLNEIFISPHINYLGQPFVGEEIYEINTVTPDINLTESPSEALTYISNAIDQVSSQRASLVPKTV